MYKFLIVPEKWVKVGELKLEKDKPYWFKKANDQIVMGVPYSDEYSSGIADCYLDDGKLMVSGNNFHIVKNGFVQPVLEK